MGLSFLENPRVKRVNLIDPSVDVIETLQNKVVDSYITKQALIKISQLRGQDLMMGLESKTVFIAGMGGKEIQDILKNLVNQFGVSDRVVISPHRNILELREYLNQSAYRVIDEMVLEEDGQFYQILCLSVDQTLERVSLYGDKIWENRKYLGHQIKSFTPHQDQRSRAYVAYLERLNY